MAIPVHSQSPGDDPERTDQLPRFDRYVETTPWWPNGAREDYVPPDRELPGDGAPPRSGRRRRRRPLWKEVLTFVAVALLMTFLIQHFLGRFYAIPSGSMEQTLHGCPGCDNDRVLVDKLSFAFADPQPGDVVVFEGPNTWTESELEDPESGNIVTNGLQSIGALVGLAPPNERDFVKRVIATGGQTVQCCDEKMRVLVDDRPLTEPYVYWDNGKPDAKKQRFDPVVVPEGSLWVMGDNRNNSADSRKQGGGGVRGVVPIDNVIGKARFIVLPTSRWQGVGDHDPQGGGAVALGAQTLQQGLPAGVGFLAAWPVLWLSRRIKWPVVRR